MTDRNLIAGVLAAQAGFVTPARVLGALAARLVDPGSDSLLTVLERSGELDGQCRKVLEPLTEEAVAARTGGTRASSCDVPLERPGRYTRLRELGRGSQSVVHAARDELVGREVALKELIAAPRTAREDSSRAARARFLREVRLVAGLDHPGVVAIYDVAHREDGTLFCAQKLIRGETLKAKLARCRTLEYRLQALRHVLDACQAIDFAHSKRVIHRDVKPSNIMLGESGETVVVDWGLARHLDEADDVVPLPGQSAEPALTVAGVALGTPAYMSPEQACGDLPAIDVRSDIFGLGATLYEVLTGRPPFQGATSEHILENARAGTYAPVLAFTPDAPPGLAAIAERALRPEPSARYQGAGELARDLIAYLTGGRIAAYRCRGWECLRRFLPRSLSATRA